jgi:hypothetical protein
MKEIEREEEISSVPAYSNLFDLAHIGQGDFTIHHIREYRRAIFKGVGHFNWMDKVMPNSIVYYVIRKVITTPLASLGTQKS